MGWWRFARLALEALTTPADRVSCDRAMEQLARESRIGAMLHQLSWMIRTAWPASRARRTLAGVLASVAPVRMRGFVMVITGATALALDALKPTPIGPLESLVPSLVIVAGVLVMLMAGPLSRAILYRTS